MINVSLLPLDERPCNIDYPEKICRNNDEINFHTIDKELLGLKKSPALLKNINEFLNSDKVINSDILIVSIDMLLYGGLTPSRLHNYTFEELKFQLDTLKNIKKKNPNLKIYAFSCIMRTPRYNSSDEEPDYYELYGEKIYRSKFLIDKKAIKGLSSQEEDELNGILIPKEIIEDYEARRDVNRNINIKVVDYLDEVIEYLIIPQDDSAEYGYTRIDQEFIYSYINKIDKNSYSIHPGADEVAMTLLARSILDYKKIEPTIFVVYTNDEFKIEIPKYEDRPLINSLDLHINAAGLSQSSSIEDVDFILIYNTPYTNNMCESWEQKNHGRDFSNITKYIEIGKKVVIVDKAYSNGGDIELIDFLNNGDLFKNILAYYGWNTNSNSLGSALGACVIMDKPDVKLLFENIVENVLYQSIVRMDVNDNVLSDLDLNYFTLADKQMEVIKIEKEKIDNLLEKYNNLQQFDYSLFHPWNRMFEIGVDVTT